MSAIVDRSLAVFFNPCAQMQDMLQLPPLEVSAAQGSWLHLADGRRLLDGIASWWCKSLGHGHPQLIQALQQQAASFEHVIAANTTHAGLVRLCERLLSMANGYPAQAWSADAPAGKLPGHFSRVFLADNGSTAVEIALKMAMQAQAQRGQGQRQDFACFEAGYHGESIATLSVGDCDLYSAPFSSKMFPSLRLRGLPYRSGRDDPGWGRVEEEWPALEAQLASQADRLAAIVYEPLLQGAGGMRIYDPALLLRLRRWADAHQVFLIADEIASGFARCGPMLASHAACSDDPSAALPDLCCLSKGLSGGVTPLSAVLLTEDMYQAFWAEYQSGRSFLHSNTWTAHPLGISVANAVLDVSSAENIPGQVAERGALLAQGLGELSQRYRALGNLRSIGMVAAVDIQGYPAAQRMGRQIFIEGIRQGIFLRPLADTLYLFPPLTISPDEIAYLLQRLDLTLQRVL